LGNQKNGCQYLCRDRCFKPITLFKNAVFIGFYIFAKVQCDLYAKSVEKNGTDWGKRLELVAKTESLGFVLLFFGI